MSEKYYKKSGKLAIMPFVGALVGGTVIAVILAYVYAYVTLYNPIIYIGFIATLIFGAGVGMGTGAISTSMNSRSGMQDLVVALIVLLVAIWAYWMIWAGISGYGDPRYVHMPLIDKVKAGPMAAYHYVFGDLADYYRITLGRRSRSGDGLGASTMNLIWIVEAILILGAGMFLGFAASETAAPYNEETKSASKQLLEKTVAGTSISNEDLTKAFEAGDFNALLALAPDEATPTGGETGTMITVYQDSKDPNFSLL
ncbi:MAG: hypothetical protein ACPGRD_02360, partial [Planktomarina sp.]